MTPTELKCCVYCGSSVYHDGICPRVKVLHADGSVELFPLSSPPPAAAAEGAPLIVHKLKGIAEHLRACYPLLRGDADVLDEAIAILAQPRADNTKELK